MPSCVQRTTATPPTILLENDPSNALNYSISIGAAVNLRDSASLANQVVIVDWPRLPDFNKYPVLRFWNLGTL